VQSLERPGRRIPVQRRTAEVSGGGQFNEGVRASRLGDHRPPASGDNRKDESKGSAHRPIN
jgi:hypothetical protein